MHIFQSFLSPENPLILQFLLKQALELQSDSTHHHSKYTYNDRARQPETGFSNQAKVQWEDSGSPHEQHEPSFLHSQPRLFFIISVTFKEILK